MCVPLSNIDCSIFIEDALNYTVEYCIYKLLQTVSKQAYILLQTVLNCSTNKTSFYHELHFVSRGIIPLSIRAKYHTDIVEC